MNPTSPPVQWKQLDKTVSSLTPDDYLAINNYSTAESLLTQARYEASCWLIPTTALLLLVALFNVYDNGLALDTVAHAGLHAGTLILLIGAIIAGSKTPLYVTPLYMGIHALYHLLFTQFVGGFSVVELLLGGLYGAFTWSYWMRVNQYQAVSKVAISDIAKSTYDALVIALSQTKPNATNKLIKIREDAQSLIIWLRPRMAIIYLDSVKRIYLDVNHTFELNIAGKDTGGDTLRVTARIDIDQRVGSISRHAWLRYTQYRY
ncbi:MAG: hypothetical protein AAFR81_02315 [Chloroflexota bacterium]